MKILSIDPGAHTALVLVSWSGEFCDDLELVDFVGFEVSEAVKTKYDRIVSYLSRPFWECDFGLIERPFAHRDQKGQVNVNAFATQIENFTLAKLAFEAVNNQQMIEIWPAKWQVILDAGKGETKEKSIASCLRHTDRRVDDHVADAYNMALWAMGIAKIRQYHQFNRELNEQPPARSASQAYMAIRLGAAGSKIGDMYE